MLTMNTFSYKRYRRCPDFSTVHKKVIYEDNKRPFKLLGDIINGLLMSEEYQNKNIAEDTYVCAFCYDKLKKISEENLEKAKTSCLRESSSSSSHSESQNTLPADSQTSVSSVQLQEEVNDIMIRNNLSLSPFKSPSKIDSATVENYVNRKRKQLFDTFLEESDCKIRKLYDVSINKLVFNECKICDEWNANFSTALENKNLNYQEKLRLITLVPSSLSNNYILSHIRGTTDYMIKTSRKLVKTKGTYEKPDPYSGHPVKSDTIKLVEKYYLDDDLDCSRQSPNKNDVISVKIDGVIEKKIKRFLTRSIKEICDIILKQNPRVIISRSKIYQLRPKWVMIQPLNDSCLCVHCANFDLSAAALKNALKKRNSEFSTLKENLLSMIVCSRKNDLCILRECESCKNKVISEENFQTEQDLLYDEITFAIWENNDLVKKTCTFDIYLKQLNNYVEKMSKHSRIKELQQNAIKLEKEAGRLNKNWLILHGDFAENWAIVQKDANQGYHWTNTQISIFTSVCYVGEITASFGIVSDDRRHDSAFALKAMNLLESECKNLTVDKINSLTIISDGAASHFKNRFQFHEFGINYDNAKWIFSATGHGKGACDGVGGLLKHYATIHNLSSSPNKSIKNAEDFVKYVSNYTSKIKLIHLKAEELQNFRTRKGKEWEIVKSIRGIRDCHIWQMTRHSDDKGNTNVQKSMKKIANTNE